MICVDWPKAGNPGESLSGLPNSPRRKRGHRAVLRFQLVHPSPNEHARVWYNGACGKGCGAPVFTLKPAVDTLRWPRHSLSQRLRLRFFVRVRGGIRTADASTRKAKPARLLVGVENTHSRHDSSFEPKSRESKTILWNGRNRSRFFLTPPLIRRSSGHTAGSSK